MLLKYVNALSYNRLLQNHRDLGLSPAVEAGSISNYIYEYVIFYYYYKNVGILLGGCLTVKKKIQYIIDLGVLLLQLEAKSESHHKHPSKSLYISRLFLYTLL